MNAPATALNSTDALIARRIDFPTWLPAMLVKELRQGLHARGFVGTLVGFQMVMTLFVIFAIAGGTGSASFNILQGAFWVVLNVQLLIITPARALLGLQAELDSRWIDLVVLTRLTAWRVVVGKWISLQVQTLLLIVAMLPYGVARYFFGSVDLMGEARLIGLTLVGSAVLTAAALWCSALSKYARIGVGIMMLFAWQFVPGSLSVLSMHRSVRPLFPVSAFLAAQAWLLVFNATLVLLICLTGAVRRLAPRAESQTALMRTLPLLAALPLPFMPARDMVAQFGVAAVLFLFVAALELAGSDQPMAVHWRVWARFGALGRAFGRLLQPGWASATEWVMAVAAVTALAALATAQSDRYALLALLAAEALLFPALLLTWMTAQFSHRMAGYALVLGGASFIAIVGAASGNISNSNPIAESALLLLPVASFWTTLFSKAPPGALVSTAQMVIAGAIVVGTWWRAAPERRQRRGFGQRVEELTDT